MTKKELLEKLRKKLAPAAVEAVGDKVTKAEGEVDAAPPAAEPANGDVIQALQALSEKLDMIGEALATMLESKSSPADDETTTDKESEEEESEDKKEGEGDKVEQGDEAREGVSEDEEDDEEMEKELEKIAAEMDIISNENGPSEQE